MYAGRYFKQIDLDPGAKVPVRLNIVADDPKYLEAKPEQLQAHRKLVDQAYKLYGARHYDHYDFLFSLSDQMGGNGLEHHRSSENGVGPEYFTDWKANAPDRDLLPHEFTHSWNGKYRRPADLTTPNFNVPMSDTLLWVYEGQTQYWGFVLAARSGLWSVEQARDAMAMVAVTYSNDRPGFAWRNVQDTTLDPIINSRRAQPYRSWQLSEDYYSAGQLIWLAVDGKLRELTGEKRSLDDFAKAFFGVNDGDWVVNTYDYRRAHARRRGEVRLGELPARARRCKRGAARRPGRQRLEAELHRQAQRLSQVNRRRPQDGRLRRLARHGRVQQGRFSGYRALGRAGVQRRHRAGQHAAGRQRLRVRERNAASSQSRSATRKLTMNDAELGSM